MCRERRERGHSLHWRAGAKKYIKESNERKRKEAARWTEKQPKRRDRLAAPKSMRADVVSAPKDPSEPLKTLRFIRDLLTEKVERIYFHVFS